MTNKSSSQESGTNTTDKSASQSGNKTENAQTVSFADSNGTDGCIVHIHAVDHTRHECWVLKKQVNKMKRSWNDNKDHQEPKKKFKSNGYNSNKGGNQKSDAGDLHALMEQAKRIKESLEKALKQQETKSEKCKCEENHMTFSGDNAVAQNEKQKHKDENFLSKLDQHSYTDDDLETNLQELKDLEPSEISE